MTDVPLLAVSKPQPHLPFVITVHSGPSQLWLSHCDCLFTGRLSVRVSLLRFSFINIMPPEFLSPKQSWSQHVPYLPPHSQLDKIQTP